MPLHPALARAQADAVRVSGFPKTPEVSIDGCFGTFLRRIVPNHNAYGLARAACDEAVQALRAELYPVRALEARSDHLIAGAVGKRTSLAPIKVVDLLYLLPAKLAASRAADAVKIIAAVLRPKFAGIHITPTGVFVPRGEVSVRIVPSREHGGAFLVPGAATLARASGWCVSNPVAEAATLRLSDSLYGGRPRLLLTTLKAWRETAGAPISAFALELLAQDFYAAAPRSIELDRALPEFWAWARGRTPCALKPPGGQSALDIDAAWHGKAKAAYWRVTLAEHHLKTGKLVEAAVEWRQLLGPAFPVPGEAPLKALPLFKKK